MDHNNTYNNKTNNNQTDDSNRIISGDSNRFDKRYDAESELKAYQSLIKENIEYECLLIAYPTEKETIEGIYKMENEYIQLPPLKRDTDLRVIMALWEYVRLSDAEREHVLTIMNEIKKDKASRMLPPLESLQNLPQKDIKDFDEVMGKIINDIIVEACDLACWVYRCKFIEGWTLEQMLDEKRNAEQFIVALYYLFEEYIDIPDDNNIRPS